MIFRRPKRPSIEITESALERLRELATASKDRETGGILLGFNRGTDILVSTASDSGPNATRSPTHFLRDTEYCREFLEQEYAISGADYVGEWHSHVLPFERLSLGDIQTIAGILGDPDYDFETFAVALVVMKAEAPELQVYAVERLVHGQDAGMRIVELHRGPFPDSTAARTTDSHRVCCPRVNRR
jgi:integrative and conjugative element protein (TIGR02256 family)